MEYFKYYRKESSPGQSSQSTRNRLNAQRRLQELNLQKYYSERALSSISLPTFTRARLRFWERHLNQKRLTTPSLGSFHISESELLAACLVLFLSKRHTLPSNHLPNGRSYRPTRQYNSGRYSYVKVTTYLPVTIWRIFQMRAIEMKVSLSQLADLALRLYLTKVAQRLQRPEKNQYDDLMSTLFHVCKADKADEEHKRRSGWVHIKRAGGREWLNSILQSCSYQIILKQGQISSFSGGRIGDFLFGYRIKFGAAPDFFRLHAKSPPQPVF